MTGRQISTFQHPEHQERSSGAHVHAFERNSFLSEHPRIGILPRQQALYFASVVFTLEPEIQRFFLHENYEGRYGVCLMQTPGYTLPESSRDAIRRCMRGGVAVEFGEALL